MEQSIGMSEFAFFAQTLNELIFDYSIPSHRLPTLNSHFLCYDAISTIADIDQHGVPEGTLRPIIEELYNTLNNDPIFIENSDTPVKYFVKEQKGKYVRIYNPNDLNYKEKRAIVLAINRKIFNEDNYYTKLMAFIKEIIIEDSEEKQSLLYDATKSFITELVNCGYDQRFIFDKLIYSFFNKYTVVSNKEKISEFLENFKMQEQKFKVVIIAKDSLQEAIFNTKNITIANRIVPQTKIQEEDVFLKKEEDDSYYIFDEIESLDPYSAAENVELSINISLSIYRLYNHTFEFDISKAKIIVYDSKGYYTIIKRKKSAVQRAKQPPMEIIKAHLNTAEKALGSLRNNAIRLILASNLHSLSLKSSSEENQLLDLWAIVECILDISQEHTSDRINQICSYMVPIIKHNYLFSLIEQIANDIKNYDTNEYNRIIDGASENFECVYKIGKFIALDAYAEQREIWLKKCNDFPLLVFRIKKYSAFLQTRGSLAKQIDTHSTKVRWQIMRAYRNRNLIIHNGETMPYTSLLIENLHSYVDTLIEHVISEFAVGHSINSIRQELFSRECEWAEMVEKNNEKKRIDEGFLRFALLM